MHLRSLLTVLFLTACTPGEQRPDYDTGTRETGSACPPPIEGLDFAISGRAIDATTGVGLAGVTVRLEDRSARPLTTFATTTSTAQGAWQLDVTDLTGWPECWNLITEHYLVATLGERTAELAINRELSEATRNERTVIDLSAKPLEL